MSTPDEKPADDTVEANDEPVEAEPTGDLELTADTVEDSDSVDAAPSDADEIEDKADAPASEDPEEDEPAEEEPGNDASDEHLDGDDQPTTEDSDSEGGEKNGGTNSWLIAGSTAVLLVVVLVAITAISGAVRSSKPEMGMQIDSVSQAMLVEYTETGQYPSQIVVRSDGIAEIGEQQITIDKLSSLHVALATTGTQVCIFAEQDGVTETVRVLSGTVDVTAQQPAMSSCPIEFPYVLAHY